VGAVSRRGLLTRSTLAAPPSGDSAFGSDSYSLFDIEQFRAMPERRAVVRAAGHPTLVLGSTQRFEIVDPQRAAAMGAEVVRRRGGGGAVLLQPRDHLWIDAWIPRDDPLWDADVVVAAAWVGRWWRDGLQSLGARGCKVHEGRSAPGEHGALVCFSGKGPGEVFQADRKVMGVSQWRGREGALFHACAYTHWDPGTLVSLLDMALESREGLVRDLAHTALGVEDMDVAGSGAITLLRDALLTTFPTWSRTD
jgi:lipoate-protein ligase A